ncbi:MAG: 2-C-methyl-D-erythritol 4-phosphate cytidylyltransferase [Actinomycetota bacterium]
MSESVSVRTVALLLAAGSGSRLGGRPKAFLEVAGEPLFLHSLRSLVACSMVHGVVMMVPEGSAGAAERSEEALHLAPGFLTARVGGVSRQDSVRLGLAAVPAETEAIVCHDAARPFASADLFRRVLAGLQSADGIVPLIPTPDTVKRVREGRIIETIPRNEIGLAQTPQAFRARALKRAHELASRSGLDGTDDAVLLESAGYRVVAVEGEPDNFKVTTPEDLLRAEAILAARHGAR